ncbi:MAG: hypothetical protein M3Y08_08240 [Fibrobacterota bacterium]|nr:hypothetical protein [Fibrobacterota bacterium]
MKHSNLSTALKTLALTGAASLLLTGLTGCMTNEEKTSSMDSDGQAAYVTTEVDQMGQVYDQIPETGIGAGKTSASGLTITGELTLEPFAYHADCECFVRHAVFTGTKGYERDRVDSVTLFDSTGATMDKFARARIDRIVHTRDVVHTKGSKEANVHIEINLDMMTNAGVKTGVWNGTMSGTYQGQEFKSGSITNLVRVWENGRFHFPEAGILKLERPVFKFMAEFLGEGKAKFKVENKRTGKIHVLFVDKNYKETDPVETP